MSRWTVKNEGNVTFRSFTYISSYLFLKSFACKRKQNYKRQEVDHDYSKKLLKSSASYI